MSRFLTTILVVVLALCHQAVAYADIDDDFATPPAEGVPGSVTDHLYQRNLGGCGFAMGAHPVGDDLVMGGTCRRSPAPSRAATPSGSAAPCLLYTSPSPRDS